MNSDMDAVDAVCDVNRDIGAASGWGYGWYILQQYEMCFAIYLP